MKNITRGSSEIDASATSTADDTENQRPLLTSPEGATEKSEIYRLVYTPLSDINTPSRICERSREFSQKWAPLADSRGVVHCRRSRR